jgi:hypothetical protein
MPSTRPSPTCDPVGPVASWVMAPPSGRRRPPPRRRRVEPRAAARGALTPAVVPAGCSSAPSKPHLATPPRLDSPSPGFLLLTRRSGGPMSCLATRNWGDVESESPVSAECARLRHPHPRLPDTRPRPSSKVRRCVRTTCRATCAGPRRPDPRRAPTEAGCVSPRTPSSVKPSSRAAVGSERRHGVWTSRAPRSTGGSSDGNGWTEALQVAALFHIATHGGGGLASSPRICRSANARMTHVSVDPFRRRHRSCGGHDSCGGCIGCRPERAGPVRRLVRRRAKTEGR